MWDLRCTTPDSVMAIEMAVPAVCDFSVRQLLETIKHNEIGPYSGATSIRVRVLLELLW